jgi:hypothetical protein
VLLISLRSGSGIRVEKFKDEKWVYRVQFIEPPPDNVSEHLTTSFTIVVLMNGEVGKVKVSPWKLS